ncbi:hypothetical protein [Acidovorax cavernicola]|uniref:Uncharacterized protein n=1 Tax=Acidovorax cavernicola TaxID=1675792 RepID=A0A9X8CZX6_9BURK|nr:hypothetical protein [Acidovorax cavernicola]RIX74453.1 hypothetical protein D3H34_27360 [Acidovorax cavernicola]
MGDPAYEREREAQRAREIDAYAKREGARLAEQHGAERRECGERSDKEPYIGAAADWVRSCSTWGAPDRVFTTENAGGVRRQWLYKNRGTLFFDSSGRLDFISR